MLKFATVATSIALVVLANLTVKSYASIPLGHCQRVEHEVFIQDIDPQIAIGDKVDVGACERSDEKYLCVPTGYRDYEYVIKLPDEDRVEIRRFHDLIIEGCHFVPVPTTPKPEKPVSEKP